MEKYKLNLEVSQSGIKYSVKLKRDKQIFFHKYKCDMGTLRIILENIVSGIRVAKPVVTIVTMTNNKMKEKSANN